MKVEDLRKDLEQMKRLLDKHWRRNILNINSLHSSVASLKRQNKRWKCQVENLVFNNIDLGKKVFPNERLFESQLKASFNIEVEDIKEEQSDCMKVLAINLSIFSKYNTLNSNRTVHASWHLDKNEEGGDEPNFFHPEYHFHFGGSAMTNALSKDYGNLLLIGSPRLAHLPLDGILAIDFIIRNFYEKKKHKSLTNKREYRNLIEKAQIRFWKPHILGLASHWENKIQIEDENLNPKKLIPNLI